ncbi:MAG: LruC domain-containing protein [Mangrovibacterium sp.]
MKRSITYIILVILTALMIRVEAQVPSYSTAGYTPISGNQAINVGQDVTAKYIIQSGNNWSGSITVSVRGTLSLIIEGTVTSISVSNSGTVEIIVGTSGSFTHYTSSINSAITRLINYSPSLKLNAIRNTVINYGTITGNSNVHVESDGTFENYGTINATELTTNHIINNSGVINVNSLRVYSTASFTNNGTITATNDVAVNNTLTNNGTINATNLYVYNNATLYNNCKIVLTGNFNCQKLLYMGAGAYIKVNGTTTFDSSNTCSFGANAFLKTYTLVNRGTVNGPSNGHGLVQYFTAINPNDFKAFGQNMYLVDGYGVDYTTKQQISFSILSSNCNDGFSILGDTDNDGIPDEQDEFPNDPERAFVSYYLGERSWKTLMFEDLWPKKGDYDFNDLVIKYKFSFHLNAQNEYVGLESNFQVAACGADYANGFGFQLNIPNSSVTNVTGYVHSGNSIVLNANKTEQGSSDEAVIIVYNNISASLGNMFNVKRNGGTKEVDPITVYVSLNKLASTTSFTINPFIYVNQERGREVHLMNTTPTSKANPSYFGTGDDRSTGGMYYRSSEGLPWALNVPEDVDHMIETIDFCVGYPKFKEWAESGGASYDTWYVEGVYTPVLY